MPGMKWIEPSFFSKNSGNPIFGQIFGHHRAENEARNTKTYRGQETPPIRIKAWYEMNWAKFFSKSSETLSTGGRTDRHHGEFSIPPFPLRWSGGIIIWCEKLIGNQNLTYIQTMSINNENLSNQSIKSYNVSCKTGLCWQENIYEMSCSPRPNKFLKTLKMVGKRTGLEREGSGLEGAGMWGGGWGRGRGCGEGGGAGGGGGEDSALEKQEHGKNSNIIN